MPALSFCMRSVDVRQLKSWARRALPLGDACRIAVESQPDTVSSDEFAALVKVLDRLLSR